MVYVMVMLKHMVLTYVVMILMVAIALKNNVMAQEVVQQVVDQKTVTIVNLIGQLTVLNAVIQLGMSMALIVQP